jgi:hypothetical protein
LTKSQSKRKYSQLKDKFQGKIAFQQAVILQNWQKIKK